MYAIYAYPQSHPWPFLGIYGSPISRVWVPHLPHRRTLGWPSGNDHRDATQTIEAAGSAALQQRQALPMIHRIGQLLVRGKEDELAMGHGLGYVRFYEESVKTRVEMTVR